MRWLLAALALTLILGNPSLAQSTPSDGAVDGLTTSWPVIAAGSTQAQADGFAARFDPTGAHQTFLLEAEKILFKMEWEAGMAVGEESVAVLNTDSGSRSTMLEKARLTISPFDTGATVFAVAEDRQGTLLLGTDDRSTWKGAQDVQVVGEGMSPDTQSSGEGTGLGFWHIAEGPVIEAQATGELRLDGTFFLFFHNLEIHAEGEDGTDWSEWTGYREEGATPVAKEFEFRVTTAQVQNGTLVAAPSEPIEYYVKDLQIQIAGRVTAQSVTGRLERTAGIFHFDQEALRLQGTGELHLHAESLAGVPWISLQPSETLQIEDKDPLVSKDQIDVPPTAGKLVAPLAALLLIAATTTGYLHTPQGKRIRHRTWSRRAEQAAHQGLLDRSARCYHRALRAIPHKPITWYELIQIELQASHGHQAELLARKAAGISGMDPMDLLAQRAMAAWLRDDQKALRDHLKNLHECAPLMAHTLTNALEIDPPGDPEDPIHGYA